MVGVEVRVADHLLVANPLSGRVDHVNKPDDVIVVIF